MKKKKKKSDIETSLEETPKGRKEVYCFPNHNITVRATSTEEAERKLRDLLKEE